MKTSHIVSRCEIHPLPLPDPIDQKALEIIAALLQLDAILNTSHSSLQNLAQAAPLRKCFFNQNGNVTRLNDLHTLISRQMGLLLVRPVVLRSRGYYHPSPSACQLSFRYGAETYVFRGEDFENLTNKMIELDINLMPQDVSLRIQQGYFKTAVFPLESFRLSTKLHRSSCPKIDPDKHVNELELKFAIDCQGNASEVVIKLEVQWLYVRRPMFLGNLDQWRNHSTEHIEQQHSEAKHVLRVSES